MNYYLFEIREAEKEKAVSRNAGGKARADTASIMKDLRMKRCELVLHESERDTAGKIGKLIWHKKAYDAMKKSLADVKSGDTVFMQFPVLCHSIFSGSFLKSLNKRGIRTVLIIHDLETLRLAKEKLPFSTKLRNRFEEEQALQYCSKIIVHNDVMKSFLVQNGISSEKIVSLQLFDYLTEGNTEMDQSCFQKDGGIVIAGNLKKTKSGYIGSLPENISWNLYGTGYEDEGKQNISYRGSYTPEELIRNLEGGFGLVWDGPSANTCTGIFGEYLRMNNPHKTSLYLAAGLPVIIWKEAALASFIEENHAGICISSLDELNERLADLTDEEYEEMKKNAGRIGMLAREGYYLKTAIRACGS